MLMGWLIGGVLSAIAAVSQQKFFYQVLSNAAPVTTSTSGGVEELSDTVLIDNNNMLFLTVSETQLQVTLVSNATSAWVPVVRHTTLSTSGFSGDIKAKTSLQIRGTNFVIVAGYYEHSGNNRNYSVVWSYDCGSLHTYTDTACTFVKSYVSPNQYSKIYSVSQMGLTSNVLLSSKLTIVDYVTLDVLWETTDLALVFTTKVLCVTASRCIASAFYETDKIYAQDFSGVTPLGGAQTVTLPNSNFYGNTGYHMDMVLYTIANVLIVLREYNVVTVNLINLAIIGESANTGHLATVSASRLAANFEGLVYGYYAGIFLFYKNQFILEFSWLQLIPVLTGNGVYLKRIKMADNAELLAMHYDSSPSIYIYEKKPCHTSCATCSGPTASHCTSCGCGVRFDFSASTCTPLPYPCLSCVSDTANCTACDPGLYILVDNNFGQCNPCNTAGLFLQGLNCYHCNTLNCFSCVNNANQCTSCAVISEYIYTQNLTCGPCDTGNGFWISAPYCSACPTNCPTCSSNTTCTSCANGFYLNAGSCLPCPSLCTACSSSTTCTACLLGSELFVPENTCGDCENTAGRYVSSLTCPKCNTTCTACSGTSENCTSCATGFVLSANNATCTSCSGNFFIDSNTRCAECSLFCKTCNGTSTNCTSCYAPNVLMSDSPACTTCGTGRFVETATTPHLCKPCPSNCDTCSSTTSCMVCSSGFFPTINDLCDACTSNGMGLVSGACLACNSTLNCKRCDGDVNVCISCPSGTFINPNGSCGACGADSFVDATKNNTCQPCLNNCKTCTGTAANCTSCNGTFFIYENDRTCVDCTFNHYVDTAITPPLCRDCSSNCSTCDSNPAHCLTCTNGTFLDPINHTCDLCTRFNLGVVNNQCVVCDGGAHCYNCAGNSSNCTKCEPAQPYLRLDSGNKCTSDCPSTNYYFTNGSVTYCDLCNANCLTCSGEATRCDSCRDPQILLPNKTCGDCSPGCVDCLNQSYCTKCDWNRVMMANQTCQASCNTSGGYYMASGLCTTCSANCKSCFGSAASCTSCIAGQYLSATNTCVPCTENGYYHNSTNCLQCDSSCLTCNGSTSTDCLTCPKDLTFVDHSCIIITPVHLLSALFKPDMELAEFSFDRTIQAPEVANLLEATTVAIFDCPVCSLKSSLELRQGSKGASLEGMPCQTVKGWATRDILTEGSKLRVRMKGSTGLEAATLVVGLPRQGFFQDQNQLLSIYPEDYLIVENVTVIKSALDGMMDSAAAPAAASMTIVQTLVMSVSAPQAFVLMKVLQSMDFYIYIECKYPSNFAKFLDMITNSAIDFVPNFFVPLTDDDGLPLYERFAEYGMKVHIFANLGQIYSVILILVAIKYLLFLVGKVIKSSRKWHEFLSLEVFFGFFDSYNIDSVLSVMIFVAQRERVNHRQDAVKYLVIVFVSLFSLFMISMYLFMGYTVSRLTDSYFKHAILKIKHMKNEKFKFLLEDKNMHGNIFQRHFNLIQLFKDIVFAALLYALYYKPLVLIILLTLIQAVFMACVFAYPPYNIAWMNNSLRCTQFLYLVLDFFFMLLLGYGDSMTEHTRYYFLGFGMIAVCIAILACNIGFTTYSTIKELRERYRRHKAKKSLVNQAKQDETLSRIEDGSILEASISSKAGLSAQEKKSRKMGSKNKPSMVSPGRTARHNILLQQQTYSPTLLNRSAMKDIKQDAKVPTRKLAVKSLKGKDTINDGNIRNGNSSMSQSVRTEAKPSVSVRTIESSEKTNPSIANTSARNRVRRLRLKVQNKKFIPESGPATPTKR